MDIFCYALFSKNYRTPICIILPTLRNIRANRYCIRHNMICFCSCRNRNRFIIRFQNCIVCCPYTIYYRKRNKIRFFLYMA